MNKEFDCFPICLLMRKNNMARVNVKVDCSPFGLGLPISLAGMEDMMYFLVSLQARAASPVALPDCTCQFQHFDFQNGLSCSQIKLDKYSQVKHWLTIFLRFCQRCFHTLAADSSLWRNGWSKLSDGVLSWFLFHCAACVDLSLRFTVHLCSSVIQFTY